MEEKRRRRPGGKRPRRPTKRLTKRLTMSVPEAGKLYFNLGRNASYDAARRGEIPTICIGARRFAVVAELDRMVGVAGDAEGAAE
jgi:hypothetical protein